MHSSESALRQYLRTIKRQAWLVVLVPTLVVVAMLLVAKTQDPIYRATTEFVVLVQPRTLRQDPELADFATMRTATAIIESEGVTRDAIRRLRLDMSAEEFDERVKVDVLPETSLLRVSYESTDPRLAVRVVRQLFQSYDARTQILARPEPGRRRLILESNVLTQPSVAPDPVGPKTGSNLIFGAVAGIALGLLLAVAREALDSRLRERKEAEQWFDAPIVGTLPKGMGRVATPRGAGHNRRAATLDLLRARMQFTGAGINGPTIVVVDSGPDMGKSTVAANLGAALARGGKRVVVVDADIRRPRLHRSLGVEMRGRPGLVDVLEGHSELEDALVSVDVPASGSNGATPTEAAGRLELLSSGSTPAPVSDIISADAVSELTGRLLKRADYVIFDSPPLSVAEAYPLAVRADNVLIVARRGRTTKDQAEWARDMLEEIGVERVGVVLTDSPPV